MNIRISSGDYKTLKKMWDKTILNREVVSLTVDEKATVPVIMIKDELGAVVEWTRGMANVRSFIKYGYVRIIKKCPYQLGKCRGEKCQLFQVRNGTGDCAHNWAAIGLWEGR